MEAGTLVSWKVAEGSSVKRGDIVALVETQKGIVDVEIWQTGVIETLMVQPGERVPVGQVLATVRELESGGESPSAPVVNVEPPIAKEPASPGVYSPSRVYASPAARQRARELGVDIHSLRGSGPHGAVTRDDVENAKPTEMKKPAVGTPPAAANSQPAPAALSPSPSPAPIPPVGSTMVHGARFERASMRRAIAASVTRSKKEIPHYYVSSDVDVQSAVTWLESANTNRPVAERLVLAAMLLKATAKALEHVPEFNGFYTENGWQRSDSIHLGVAIALRGGGLVAPAIHDANRLSMPELMRALGDLVARARAGRLRSSELADATITVTNLGDLGVDTVFGVIFPPQVALVGFGAARERPWASGGMLGVRSVIHASISADHRATDGSDGARFLRAIATQLAHPEAL